MAATSFHILLTGVVAACLILDKDCRQS